MTEGQLQELGIKHWNEISGKYEKPDLLLGNGFSMKHNERFSYDSLFSIFLSKCPIELHEVYKCIGTTNFERILEYLLFAAKINESLKLDTTKIREAIAYLKQGLIQAINIIHPSAGSINRAHLQQIAVDFDHFNDVYTTNYDLYLYQIVMLSVERHENELKKEKKDQSPSVRPYNDYFWGRKNAPEGFTEFVEYQKYQVYKNIYYLHGALFIYPFKNFDIKLLRELDVELIEVIAGEINANHFPLFVTEGTSEDKLNSIVRSPYLRFCLRQLKKSKAPLLVFGNSLSSVDQHLVDAIKFTGRPIIYAIYVGKRDERSIKKEMHEITAKFPKITFPIIEFVDSATIFSI